MIAVIEGGKVVEIGNHEELISNPNNVYASLVQIQEQPLLKATFLWILTWEGHQGTWEGHQGESSSRATSFRGSFRSDKESTSRAFGDGAENVGSSRHVSARRLYSMIGPDWLYGVFGTLGAFIAGAQMPLFALGISHALVAYYMDWDTTRHEVKKIAFLFCGAAVLTITAHAIEHLSFGIMGNDLPFGERKNVFRKAYLKANMLAGEAVSNIRTVAAFCAEQKVLDLYANELVEPSKRSFNRGQIAGIFYGISQFFIFSSYGLALWYGSVLMEKELSSFKSVMKSFMVLIVTALAMGETLALAPDLLKGNQMVASIFEVMDRKTGILSDVGEELKTVEGTIELKRIHFSYPSRPDVVIFNDFNLTVPAGRNIALVGHSGCGKSSVISLILRFYDPTSGKVMVDGKDIQKLNLKSLRKHIGLVQQEPALFATSIYENILYGKEGASEAEVIEAGKLANAHSFISALPEGYSTKVGERGVQLSGGQKQRVAIARAVLKNPEILLLDEATSALDLESERVVQQALDKLMQNRTTVIVAHRLSTIRNADQIAVLEDGKIVERGTHSRLLENTDGAYYKLVSLQQQQHVQ
ncbi:ABC transporter B family member 10 [Spatholobus suberectus]|nr:ABC transporter B family member 10 [Spatholobus suberectus]